MHAQAQDLDVLELFSGVGSIAKGFRYLPASEGLVWPAFSGGGVPYLERGVVLGSGFGLV